MEFTTENILLLGSFLLFVSIIASKTSFKIGVPTLILFLGVGMLAGSDGPGGIQFDDPEVAKLLGVIALTLILFSGGLDTKWESVKPILRNGFALSTVGVLITASLVGIFSSYLLGFTLLESLLLGAIVSSTDAAAVFSILRSQRLGLKGHVRPLLELESGSNDPMAYFLTISLIYLLQNPEVSVWALLPKFFIEMIVGVIAGYAFGKLMVWLLNHIKLDIDGLYPVLVLALIFFAFSLSDSVGGNGFLAVYIAGIIMGNSSFMHKKSLIRFYDGQAWLMQIIMFLTLGLLVFPSHLPPIMGKGVLISLFLIFVARPIAVFASLAFAKDLNIRKKLFISWVGLRGAAPIVFATYPLIAGIHYADTIFHLVFFISAMSVLLQGTTLPLMAKWLHVIVPEKVKRKFPLDLELKDNSKSELIELDVPEESRAVGRAVLELKLPRTAMIVLIHRGGRYITANGDTIIEPQDHLLVMADSKESVDNVYESFGIPIPHH